MGAGGDFHALKQDPAIERWAHMRENVYQTFTFTKRASRTALALGLVVPAAIAAIAMTYDEKYDWAGKRREDSLYTKAPAAKE